MSFGSLNRCSVFGMLTYPAKFATKLVRVLGYSRGVDLYPTNLRNMAVGQKETSKGDRSFCEHVPPYPHAGVFWEYLVVLTHGIGKKTDSKPLPGGKVFAIRRPLPVKDLSHGIHAIQNLPGNLQEAKLKLKPSPKNQP